jgi:hypothetical protein
MQQGKRRPYGRRQQEADVASPTSFPPWLPPASSPAPSPAASPLLLRSPAAVLPAFQSWAPEGKGGSSRGGAAGAAGERVFPAPPRLNRSSERVFRSLPRRSRFSPPFGSALSKIAPGAVGGALPNAPRVLQLDCRVVYSGDVTLH